MHQEARLRAYEAVNKTLSSTLSALRNEWADAAKNVRVGPIDDNACRKIREDWGPVRNAFQWTPSASNEDYRNILSYFDAAVWDGDQLLSVAIGGREDWERGFREVGDYDTSVVCVDAIEMTPLRGLAPAIPLIATAETAIYYGDQLGRDFFGIAGSVAPKMRNLAARCGLEPDQDGVYLLGLKEIRDLYPKMANKRRDRPAKPPAYDPWG